MLNAVLSRICVSRGAIASYLGYERTAASRPVLLDRLLRALHRGSFLVLWEDIERIERQRVLLRGGYERRPSALVPEAEPAPETETDTAT